jgi:hypothetical protein
MQDALREWLVSRFFSGADASAPHTP